MSGLWWILLSSSDAKSSWSANSEGLLFMSSLQPKTDPFFKIAFLLSICDGLISAVQLRLCWMIDHQVCVCVWEREGERERKGKKWVGGLGVYKAEHQQKQRVGGWSGIEEEAKVAFWWKKKLGIIACSLTHHVLQIYAMLPLCPWNANKLQH